MTSTPAELVTPALLRGWRLSTEASGKEDRGTVLVVGGARSTPGAVMLTGLAGLRVGAGRLTMGLAESAAIAVAVAIPESGVVGLPEEDGGIDGAAAGKVLESDLSTASAVVIGPGLDDAEQAAALLQSVVPLLGKKTQVVLDAFALGVLPGLPELYDTLAGRLVLTPNGAEILRLLEDEDADEDSLDLPKASLEVARKYSAVVSAHNVITAPDGRSWEVPAGNSGLGTSGSGDVLAGAVGGFLARGATPEQAACWGTYLHAVSGDRLSASRGPLSFLARELLEAMPPVIAELS
ncbi:MULTISPECIES: NAD(P)H-hydrate dehydratase [unclassified Arthrobacter]|uniref:NAD(P)H-hydrate dehydratase n=1 Tax=unclassified Arthrobacter TaxID=235627 RepID=UPI001D135692|nr:MULTISPECIES: NAD(P)H-hydrate dehydratase [unclassified Arthrobacter]MCC3290109.1 NAD(P)H-hydrate dehydratase [Arthrobacter sp. zg-Y1110]MCC3300379.1 NAD(P)H-hydrate dehydratase [Arthrobacter sp. zg-Y895]UWX84498.1 NAD(P)H-hydrate dehydratase [Arthrobacter sp. zg-Y1110]